MASEIPLMKLCDRFWDDKKNVVGKVQIQVDYKCYRLSAE
jgi:hypothetical protein